MLTESGFEYLIRWVQVIISIAYPIAIVAVLWLARRDFRRWVDDQLRRSRLDNDLQAEVKEFIE